MPLFFWPAKRRKKSSHGNQPSQSSSGNNPSGGNSERGNNGTGSGSGNSGSHQDKPSRGGGGTNSLEDQDHDPPATTQRIASKSRNSQGGGGAGGSSSSSAKKHAGKRKTNKKEQQQSHKHDPESDQEFDVNQIEIDPDEPTYCLCEQVCIITCYIIMICSYILFEFCSCQVSYGDMIGCDNDLCPIEWFHFQCVQLATKPKGRWFCPKCRGDKATVMKPKAQFLKELDKFNKEREEKMSKQGN